MCSRLGKFCYRERSIRLKTLFANQKQHNFQYMQVHELACFTRLIGFGLRNPGENTFYIKYDSLFNTFNYLLDSGCHREIEFFIEKRYF